jgi:hypothetical protein
MGGKRARSVAKAVAKGKLKGKFTNESNAKGRAKSGCLDRCAKTLNPKPYLAADLEPEVQWLGKKDPPYLSIDNLGPTPSGPPNAAKANTFKRSTAVQ